MGRTHGAYTANGVIDSRVAEVHARFERRKPPQVGQLVKAKCPHCPCRTATVEWTSGINIVTLQCLDCAREFSPPR